MMKVADLLVFLAENHH